jgi:Flp pilus assembly pilin Flp
MCKRRKMIKKIKQMFLDFKENEDGASTAEYAIIVLAATGFAGVMIVILQSGTVKNWLQSIIQKALSV